MPSYAQTIFAKPLDEITEADLTNYYHSRLSVTRRSTSNDSRPLNNSAIVSKRKLAG
jgi:hypothetical protein